VDESKTVPLPWDKEKSFANKFIERYNENIRIFCKKRNVHFVDIFNEWIEVDYKNLLKDGLHPNSAGHKKIFEDVSDFMEKKRLI
jgi:lysophospholipase L1-like esterase